MSRKQLLLLPACAFAFGFLGWSLRGAADTQRIYELCTYTAPEGKLPELQARFRNHTIGLFEKHGIKSIGYWVPSDEPLKSNTLIYVLAHKNREEAAKNWTAFRSDPEWIKARDASEAKGKIVEKVVSVFMDPTDYSPLK